VRDGQRLVHVLLDQKHRDAARVDCPDDVEVLLDQKGREPERRLVNEQEFRRPHHPPDRDHRLLAARHGAGDLSAALAQPGERVVDLVDARARRFRPLLVGADAVVIIRMMK
jgi:hypothetical protein